MRRRKTNSGSNKCLSANNRASFPSARPRSGEIKSLKLEQQLNHLNITNSDIDFSSTEKLGDGNK